MADSNKNMLGDSNDNRIIVNDNTVDNVIHISDKCKKLLCIEYPGYVKNVDKMIETLGGIQSIEMAASGNSKHLELKFRPNDIFCKSCIGDEDFKTKILVEVTVKKPKLDSNNLSGILGKDVNSLTTFKYELVGTTSMNIKFKHPCDFQYLPLVSTEKLETKESKSEYIYHDIIPKTLPDMDWLKSKENMPFFTVPKSFVRHTTTENKLFYNRHEYYEEVFPEYAKQLIKKESGKEQRNVGLITRTRKARKFYSTLVNFRTKNLVIPSAPKEDAVQACKEKGLEGSLEKLRELFEERPIWPRTALQHRTQIRNAHLKILLPAVSFYCKNGPWRAMWIKFGYDPRQDPKSRIYQTFDLRISEDGLKIKIPSRFAYNKLLSQNLNLTPNKFTLKTASLQSNKEVSEVDENMYILKPDVLPIARQMLYQYCYINLKEIQDMLNRLPEDPKNLHYDNKNGWLPRAFEEHCREIANEYITALVKKLLLEEKKDKEKDNVATPMEVDTDVPGTSISRCDVTITEPSIVISDDDEEDEEEGAKNCSESDDEFPEPNNMSESDEDDNNIDAMVNDIENLLNRTGEGESDEDDDDGNKLDNLMNQLWKK